jgi:hypothetical protein
MKWLLIIILFCSLVIAINILCLQIKLYYLIGRTERLESISFDSARCPKDNL